MNKEEGKIFIVTSGEYSGYSIDRVFSARKKALEYLDTCDNNYRLEVYDIDEPVERNMHIYKVTFELDKKKVIDVAFYYNKSNKDLIHIGSRCFNQIKTLEIFVESDSRKRALKIASERYGAIIAGEQTMYPYLRVGVIRYIGTLTPGYFDFNTGELVLLKCQQLGVDLPAFIKVRKEEHL